MKNVVALLAMLGFAVFAGCNPPAESGGDANTTTAEVSATSTILCGTCGEVKGSDACCDDSVASCDCGFHKGSALCCKHVENNGQDVCADCGQTVDGAHTCSTDAEKCAECGLVKDSAGCCKLGEAS
ncbi:MAG: hypothetical protein KDA87_05225 [Planctomycetales bacterium]|nr:hypothetical protein [Planctomycetales bacterium]